MQSTTAAPRAITRMSLQLRLEGLAIFMLSAAAFASTGAPAWVFIALLLVPDVAMVGYLKSATLGALIYNLGHNLAAPALLMAAALLLPESPLLPVALVWFAHIGMDRAAGYGLKYPTSFQDTHLQRV